MSYACYGLRVVTVPVYDQDVCQCLAEAVSTAKRFASQALTLRDCSQHACVRDIPKSHAQDISR